MSLNKQRKNISKEISNVEISLRSTNGDIAMTCLILFLVLLAAAALNLVAIYFWLSLLHIEVLQLQSDFNTTTNLTINYQRLIINYGRIYNLNDQLRVNFKMSMMEVLNLKDSINAEITRRESDIKEIYVQLNDNNNLFSDIVTIRTKQGQRDIFVSLSRQLGHSFASCAIIRDISPTSQSGIYLIRELDGSITEAYCNIG